MKTNVYCVVHALAYAQLLQLLFVKRNLKNPKSVNFSIKIYSQKKFKLLSLDLLLNNLFYKSKTGLTSPGLNSELY